ncbi:hypothetical protein EKN83_04830 [Enterobacter sp. WCHEn090032]|nr:hypothetical protein EKN83_04830 [Enterobacter sp. WCHEn090032]
MLVNVEVKTAYFDFCLHSAIAFRCYRIRGHHWYDLFILANYRRSASNCEITASGVRGCVQPARFPSPEPV